MESISIPNCPPDEMRQKVNAIPFLAYHVETLADGRKICITKPGGKRSFGRMMVNDIMVWIYDEAKQDRLRISHGVVQRDVEEKLKADYRNGSALVDLMLRVCNGEEPEMLGDEIAGLVGLPGLSPELILKVYKWIWVQEDCNNPPPRFKGRRMFMDAIVQMREAMRRF
jgi:hypothetical protein